MSHPDEAAFIRAICESPGDDAPRLVFADWLEERGQAERAEFIRSQCELTSRAEELLDAANFWEWFGPTLRDVWTGTPAVCIYPNWPATWCEVGHWERLADDARRWTVYVKRGFISRVVLPYDDYEKHSSTLFAQQPVTRVEFGSPQILMTRDESLVGWWRYSRLDAPHRATGTTQFISKELLDGLFAHPLRVPHRSSTIPYFAPSAVGLDASNVAQQAMSEVAVAVARSKAGLPPLEVVHV